MSPTLAPDPASLTAEDPDLPDDANGSTLPTQPILQPHPSRSPYHLPASEQLRGVANRIIFSRYYILFYFVMMALSLTTVVLSLMATRRLLSYT